MSVIGIDFGTQNCTIAAAQKGGIDVLLNEVSNRQTPCMASFGEKERALGESALTQFARNTKNTVINAKRFIGRSYDEKEVQEELKNVPFKSFKNENGQVGIEVTLKNQKRQFDATAVSAMILGQLKDIAEKATGKPCKDVVISIPGWWTTYQRQALLDASRVAQLNCLKLISDHAASALQYGIYKTNLSETEPTNVVFVDMGYANTTVSVVEFLKGKLRVLTTEYDRTLGGRDFDRLLVDHFAKEFLAKYKIDVKSNEKASIRMEVACEKMKKVLNTVPEAPLNIDSLMNDIDVKGTMKKADFEVLCQPLLEKLVEVVNRALASSKLPNDKIFAVEITGGSTRLQAVQNKLAEAFQRDISKTLNQEESVARGCALQCAILSPIFKVREFSLTDLQPYPIKVTWNKSKETEENVLDLFPEGSTIPSSKICTFYRNEALEVVAEYSRPDLLPPSATTFISKLSIPTIPPSKQESPKLRLKVKLDHHGILSAESAQLVETVEEAPGAAPATPAPVPAAEPTKMDVDSKPTDPAAPGTPTTGEKKEEQPKKKKVKRTDLTVNEQSSALSAKVLHELIESEASMFAEDKLTLETAERKNAIEAYVYDMKSKLSESLASYTTEAAAQEFNKLLEDAQNWIYEEGAEQTKSVYVKKLDDLKVHGDPIMKRRYEDENRFDAVKEMRTAINNFRIAANSEEPKYDHIEKSERSKILDECDGLEKQLNDSVAKQDRLPKNVDPVITVADLKKKKLDLERMANAILSKPKPAPPKVEKPKEPEQPKPTDAKTETPATEQAAPPKEEEPKQMDLD